MSKTTKNYMMGVAFGFLGMILYCLSLEGYEYISYTDILDYIKQAAVPFAFTELWVAITIEGLRNLKAEFKDQKDKLNKKFKKEAEA